MAVLDEPMAEVAQILVNTFVDKTRAFRRVVTTYNPLDPSASTSVTALEQIKTGPIAPYETREVNGASILTGDKRVVVTRKHLEAKGFDPHPSSDTVVSVQDAGEWLKVLRVKDFESGDVAAAYELHLRR